VVSGYPATTRRGYRMIFEFIRDEYAQWDI
jgi:hypothetical protein